MAHSEELFDPAELRAWQSDPRGKRFWDAVQEMGNLRMKGVRQALRTGNQHDQATHLAGELEAVDEIRQLVDIIIDEHRKDQDEEKAEKETNEN
jgi:ATP adenylyltransferase/5',5'''-P-1,P-4-tetraphosphate phosphorylase II